MSSGADTGFTSWVFRWSQANWKRITWSVSAVKYFVAFGGIARSSSKRPNTERRVRLSPLSDSFLTRTRASLSSGVSGESGPLVGTAPASFRA